LLAAFYFYIFSLKDSGLLMLKIIMFLKDTLQQRVIAQKVKLKETEIWFWAHFRKLF